MDDRGTREFSNVWGNCEQSKTFRHLPHVVPPQSGDIHCSLWILRKVELISGCENSQGPYYRFSILVKISQCALQTTWIVEKRT